MELGAGGRGRVAAAGVWAAILLSIAVIVWMPSYVVGWDLAIYGKAVASLRQGHDPYLDAMAVQRAFHATLAQHPHATPPYSYVYSPMTLPLLRGIARFPLGWSATVYWVLYAVCLLTTLYVGWWAAERREKAVLAVLAPLSLFFPGLLHQDTLLSGNVAFLVYGAVLGAALLGWRKGVFWPFYVAVVAASVVKAPLLSLVVIPVLSARRQWVPAGVSAAAGLVLFAVQPYVWPAAFQHFLEAVELQFSFNRDFSSSPAGVVADLLFTTAPYRVVSAVVYALTAVPVLLVLYALRRRYLDGFLRLKEWVPVLLVGAVLLNPRIMEYDAAPVALPLALVLWRLLHRGGLPAWRVGLEFVLVILMINAFAALAWKPTECVVLVGLFAGGSADLWRRAQHAQAAEGAMLRDVGAREPVLQAAR